VTISLSGSRAAATAALSAGGVDVEAVAGPPALVALLCSAGLLQALKPSALKIATTTDSCLKVVCMSGLLAN
jgi:hypothetical protein